MVRRDGGVVDAEVRPLPADRPRPWEQVEPMPGVGTTDHVDRRHRCRGGRRLGARPRGVKLPSSGPFDRPTSAPWTMPARATGRWAGTGRPSTTRRRPGWGSPTRADTRSATPASGSWSTTSTSRRVRPSSNTNCTQASLGGKTDRSSVAARRRASSTPMGRTAGGARTIPDVTEPLAPSVGLGVLHLFYRVTHRSDRAAITAAVKAARGRRAPGRARRHARTQGRPRRSWRSAPTCGGCGACRPISPPPASTSSTPTCRSPSCRSTPRACPSRCEQARLHPQLPPEGKPAWCFYPMSKRASARAELVHPALRRAQGADVRARRIGPERSPAGSSR